jgi:hypothetical protein
VILYSGRCVARAGEPISLPTFRPAFHPPLRRPAGDPCRARHPRHAHFGAPVNEILNMSPCKAHSVKTLISYRNSTIEISDGEKDVESSCWGNFLSRVRAPNSHPGICRSFSKTSKLPQQLSSARSHTDFLRASTTPPPGIVLSKSVIKRKKNDLS